MAGSFIVLASDFKEGALKIDSTYVKLFETHEEALAHADKRTSLTSIPYLVLQIKSVVKDEHHVVKTDWN